RAMLERIHNTLACDVLTLDVYHPAQDKLDLGGIHDKTGTYHDRPHPLSKEHLPYALLTEARTPLFIPDARQHALFANSPFCERESVASVLILSLHHAKETVGILFINYRQQHEFTDYDYAAIERFQRHLSMALLNARLFEERRQAIEQREQLSSLVKVIDVERNLNQQDREAILNEIANRASEVSGADRVTIRLVQDDHVAALAVYPRSEEDADENWTIRPGGHSQHIVDTNEPVIISDVDAYDPARYGGIPINPRWQDVWKARIGLPLTSGEKTIGVMWLSFREPRYVTDVQLSAFQSFANIAFLTKMYDIEQERLQHALKILADAHHLIHAASNTDAILRQTMHIAQRLVMSRDGSTRCISHIGTVVRDSTLVFLPQHNDEDVYDLLVDALPPDGRLDLQGEDACLVADVVRTGEPIMITDASQQDNFLPLLTTEKSGSQIAVPIWVGDEIMAVVSVENAHPNRFAWYDQATLEVLASFVGQVLRNRQQQRMRAALFEASRAISTGRDLQAVLQAIARQTHAVLAVKRGVEDHQAYIGLREGETLIFHAGYPHDTLQRIDASGHRTVDLHTKPVGVSATAMLTNTPQLVDDVRDEQMAFQDADSQASVVSILAVPIPNLTEDQPAVGVISLGHTSQGQFDENDRDFMMLLAKFAAVAIRRAQEIDAQTAQRESLWELTHAAMHQMIASHHVSNFRSAYNLNYPALRSHINVLWTHKEPILKQINDSLLFDIVEALADNTQEPLAIIDTAYRDLTEQETKLPELGETTRLPLREWLWNTYHTPKYIRLQLDRSITDAVIGIIPKYWLREVIKIVLDNALRAIKEAGYNPTERVIQMHVAIEGADSVSIRITNPGQLVPEALRPLLTHRVIKRDGGGRGIGLYMSGIIMRAYQGDIQYQVVEGMSSFVLRIPITHL
ncbi:MAG: GAF domain-containing protein, partial [Chloroflexota bacterium]